MRITIPTTLGPGGYASLTFDVASATYRVHRIAGLMVITEPGRAPRALRNGELVEVPKPTIYRGITCWLCHSNGINHEWGWTRELAYSTWLRVRFL